MGKRNMRVITKPFSKNDAGRVWVYITNFINEHNRVPNSSDFKERFPEYEEWAMFSVLHSHQGDRS